MSILNPKEIEKLAKRTHLTEQESQDLKESWEALKVAIDKVALCFEKQGVKLSQACKNLTKSVSGSESGLDD